MFKQFTREEILERLHREIESGRPIVGAGAGIGITAKFAEIGGADLIVVYNSGLFRMNGVLSVSLRSGRRDTQVPVKA